MSGITPSLESKANPQQFEAILATEGPVLIIAGPGSGKTFTLVERIVYLIKHKGVAPESLFVVTFTDKAARELTTRISNRLTELGIKFNLNEMYLGTFHSICLRILEDFREFTRLKRSFTLFDQFDQQYFLYQRIKEFRELPDAQLVMGDDQSGRWAQSESLLKWLNKVSEEALDAVTLAAAPEVEIRALAACFAKYQELLHENNSLDFSGIQYEALQLLEKRPEVLAQLREKLTYLMVDEYQDTNTIQERILLLLAGEKRNLCVVGDDDQGLYRFRGATSLNAAGTRVVACYNYTGTPYVGREVLPEVVYAYGLKEAIQKAYLKKVVLHGYGNTRTDEFVDIAIEAFLKESGSLRPEGLLPKLAFFAATIDELTGELKPTVERALLKHGIPTSRILVNVGDEKLTTNDDIREFNRLDTEGSEKQFILLVNKGREGWNCRSLFGVGLFREPKSKVFVLQATMRCLRAIGEAQHTGHVFLSDDNLNTLNDELQQNFRISVDDLQKTNNDKERVEVRVVQPPVKIKLVRVRKQYQMREKQPVPGQQLVPERADREAWKTLIEKYRLIETQQEGLSAAGAARASGSRTFDLTARREKRAFSPMTLVAEVSRYLNLSPIGVEGLLDATKEGTGELVAMTNEFNELLYDEIIPRLFRQLYDLDESQQTEEHEVELIKLPPNGYYEVTAAKDKIVRMDDDKIKDEERAKSFHLDTYCFDSGSESWLFWDLLREQRVKKIYFTGMLTHGQSDFFIQYIDPDSRTVRSYYPDFIFQREEPDGSLKYVIVEVKADNQIEDAVVQAKKEFAQQIAVASGMEYQIIKSTDADKRHYRVLM